MALIRRNDDNEWIIHIGEKASPGPIDWGNRIDGRVVKGRYYTPRFVYDYFRNDMCIRYNDTLYYNKQIYIEF